MKSLTTKPFDLAVVTLLRLIKDYTSISQAELSKISGYSRSTVSINCEKLLSGGYIISDEVSNKGQKKNIGLRLNKNLGYVLGIGLGGSLCRIALCDIEGTVLHVETFPIDLLCGPEPVMDSIFTNIDKVLTAHQNKNIPILGIGMGIPSPVNYETGSAFHPAFMPGWHLFPIKEVLEERYNCPAFVDNEVNTLALGEFVDLENPCGVLLCVKVGTGIGAGIVINRSIYRGEKGGGGNIGHIQLEGQTTPCNCGKIGCIEAVASLLAIEKQAEEIAIAKPDSSLAKIYAEKKCVSISDLRQAADKGDRYSLEIIRKAGTSLGDLLGKLTIFLDPGKIIIAGRSSLLGPIYLDYIRKETLKQSNPWTESDFTIGFSQSHENNAAKGAALLCIDELFAHQHMINLKNLS